MRSAALALLLSIAFYATLLSPLALSVAYLSLTTTHQPSAIAFFSSSAPLPPSSLSTLWPSGPSLVALAAAALAELAAEEHDGDAEGERAQTHKGQQQVGDLEETLAL